MNKKKEWMQSVASIKTVMLLALMAFVPFELMANEDVSYPMETVKWDKVPAENRVVVEQLFADMILVPEGEGVKKFYISTHEVQESLWLAVDSTDIQQFITTLRKQTGKLFRLPTAAERQWAAQCLLIDTIADAAAPTGKGFHLALDTIAKAEPKMLVITALDGTQTKYLLDKMPRVSIVKPDLVISAGNTSVSFPLEQLQHMHYEKAPAEAEGIEEIFVLDEKAGREHVDFSNLPAGAAISIYTLDGKQLYSHRPAEGKTLSLPLSSLQSGIYLVKVNDVTYKIQKP